MYESKALAKKSTANQRKEHNFEKYIQCATTLSLTKIGCWIGSVYVGLLAYADDVTLLAPKAMRLQLQICEDYAREYRIVFNATKSATMFIARRKVRICDDLGLQFFIDGKLIPTVEDFPHLGHIVTTTLDEKSDILAERNSLCGKINNVLCYFNKCDPFVKLKLVMLQ